MPSSCTIVVLALGVVGCAGSGTTIDRTGTAIDGKQTSAGRGPYRGF